MTLTLAVLAIAGEAVAEPEGRVVEDLPAAIAGAAAASGLPERLIEAVIEAESGGDPRAVSRAGAMGLMQLMPGTWRELRDRLALGADPFDVGDNVMAGAQYLREMLDRFGREGFLAAYNAGPARYSGRLAGRPLPAETARYVARIQQRVEGEETLVSAQRLRRPSWTYSPLFPDQ